MSRPSEELDRLADSVKERFESEKRVLSYEEYLSMFVQHPGRHARDAATYLRDCFDHYGSYAVESSWGNETRWRLFDLEFARDGGTRKRQDHLIGQEAIQEVVYRALQNFVREGRANRLLLLHGPNGSAKSTFNSCIMRALEDYSTQEDGALYRFSWIFPRGRDGVSIGFGPGSEPPSLDDKSYAYLPEERIEAKLPSELREHPLFLLPLVERRRLLSRVAESAGLNEAFPDWIWQGQLGQKNRQIFEALLTSYRGDLLRVFAHVQVERYYISRRYRVGAVTIGPQMAVDAHERQVTASHSLSSLPASLSSLTLYEPYGELVDASSGIVEYSDLLKRPLEAWKYLLLAIEAGEVALPMSNLPLNIVMIASSNEGHLAVFKEHPEYASFRGRIELVRAPYLLNFHQEQAIYESQIVAQIRRHVAPHAVFVVALWAVLTRLKRARAEVYDSPLLGRIAADLSPLEKAELYAESLIPGRLSADEAKELKSGTALLHREWDGHAEYEGIEGASPREVRGILLDAALDPTYQCLSPIAVLRRIEAFCTREDHEFLRLRPDHGYHDAKDFVRQVRKKWLDRVDLEFKACTGLIDETQYSGLFDRYITHVSFWVKGERIYNRVTGASEDPDIEFMEKIEKMLRVSQQPVEFRRNLISAVAARAIDHPGEKVDYSKLFPRYLQAVREAYFGDRHRQIATIARNVLAMVSYDDTGRRVADEQEEKTLEQLIQRFGYEHASIRDALSELVRDRYTE